MATRLPLPILLLLLLPILSFTTPTTVALTLTKDLCVNPSGYSTCRQAAVTAAQTCYTQTCAGSGKCEDENNCTSSDDTCTNKCVCGAYESFISCALEYCYNAVYTCEYMNLLINAERKCPAAGQGVQLPYYPPASDGSTPDSCSCDIYAVFEAHRDANARLQACWLAGGNRTDVGRDQCGCCAASEAVSSFFTHCPTTLASTIPFLPANAILAPTFQTLISPRCQAAFSPSNNLSCSSLNFTIPGSPPNSPFLTPQNLPPNGTLPLSDRPGSATTPVGGAVVTWTFASGTTATVTAVASGLGAAGTGGDSTTGSTPTGTGAAASGTGSSRVSSTSSSAVATASKASGAVPNCSRVFWIYVVLASGAFVYML